MFRFCPASRGLGLVSITVRKGKGMAEGLNLTEWAMRHKYDVSKALSGPLAAVAVPLEVRRLLSEQAEIIAQIAYKVEKGAGHD